jgi:prepilin-type processing-associated H-X9-DG protein
MSRRVAALLVIVLLAVGAVVVGVPYVQRTRLNANFAASQNNLRDLALFAAHHVKPDPRTDPTKLPTEIPAATVVLPGVPPDGRLSWVVPLIPSLDQRRHPVEQLLTQVRPDRPWADPANQEAARTRLAVFLCPENTPEVPPGDPAVTCYVGVAGLGRDAAALPLLPGVPTPPRAGAFRYDAPTPFDRITDGLSQTLLMAETADAPGPWLRGGFSTARGLDDAPGAAPPIGAGGQFGGFFPGGANVAMCDGAVRTFSPRTDPAVLYRLATIAGGANEIGVPD